MQQIALFDIDQDTKNALDAYLAQGYILHQIVNLQPSINKLLVVYYDPPPDPSE